MDCVNHSGVNATAYCQSCGKALCEACVRKGSGGQIFCEPCWMAWQSAQRSYVPPPMGGPSPGLAALLGVDSRRGRDVQRPVREGHGARGDLRGAGERGARVRRVRPLHRGLDLLPDVRGVSHGEGAARWRSAARSAGIERGEQLVFDGHAAATGSVILALHREREQRARIRAPSRRPTSRRIKLRTRLLINQRTGGRGMGVRAFLQFRQFRLSHRCRRCTGGAESRWAP